MQESVEDVVQMMHENLGERITIDDMARTAMFSKFHFTRLFQQATGVSPGRFLSALRLQEAKRLLLSTSLSVTEISNRVGYSSVGTFSYRFKSSVGLPPTDYRRRGGFTSRIPVDERRRSSAARSVTVRGEIRPAPDGAHGLVFVGLFPSWIPEGAPVRCAVLQRPGPFTLEHVPQGTWHLLAQSVPYGHEEVIDDEPPLVGTHGPITVQPGMTLEPADVQLRPMRALDPPVLLALLDARRVALSASGA
jgi:AraC-like DNA-binding protein